MATPITFYEGLKEKYDVSVHGDGIYFATDTLEILHNGDSYGYLPTDVSDDTESVD